jgi:hypothetical protein
MLLRALAGAARSAGTRQLSLSVGRENLARRLYLDEGYRVVPAGSASDPESETMIKDL